MPRPPRSAARAGARRAGLALVAVLVGAGVLAPAAPARAVSGVLIVSPERGGVVPASVRVDVRAYEAASLDVTVDGVVRGTDSTPEPYSDPYSPESSGYQLFSVVVDLTGLSGDHRIGAVGHGAAGETDSKDAIDVVVDTVAPTLTVPATLSRVGEDTIITASEPLLAPTEGAAVLRDSTGARLPLRVYCHATGDPGTGAQGCTGSGASAYPGFQLVKGTLVVGERYVLELAPSVTDRAGNRPARSTYPVRARTKVGDVDPVDLHWASVRRTGASGGTYLQSRDPGSSLVVLTGDSSLVLRVVKGPGLGVLSVQGGARPLRVDLYSPSVAYATVRYDFGCGTGCFLQFAQLSVTGSRNPRSSGTAVAIDDVQARTGSEPVRAAAVAEAWTQASTSGAAGGNVGQSSTPGSYAQLRFHSTRVDWAGVVGPDQGLADVYVDGRRVQRVDGYATSRRLVHRVITVPDGVHVLRVVPVGSGRTGARGAWVGVDTFAVR